jgi:hypothetical protein
LQIGSLARSGWISLRTTAGTAKELTEDIVKSAKT